MVAALDHLGYRGRRKLLLAELPGGERRIDLGFASKPIANKHLDAVVIEAFLFDFFKLQIYALVGHVYDFDVISVLFGKRLL